MHRTCSIGITLTSAQRARSEVFMVQRLFPGATEPCIRSGCMRYDGRAQHTGAKAVFNSRKHVPGVKPETIMWPGPRGIAKRERADCSVALGIR